MCTSVLDAISVINAGSSSSQDDYLKACEYLVRHREDLPYRVFICLPGGLHANTSGMWEEVKAGSQERCSCGNERVINPLILRTEFEAAPGQLVVAPDKSMYLKPVGGDKASTLVCLDIERDALIFIKDPFAPFVMTLDFFSPKGYGLQQLAVVLYSQPEPPVFKLKFAGMHIPVFAINAVDVAARTVTITLDIAVEAFDPDELPEHTCA